MDRDYIDAEAKRALLEIERRRHIYLHGRAPLPIEGRTAIVVDDGIATGTTVRAALRVLRVRHPAQLVLAVPVAPSETIASLRAEVDQIVCRTEPSPFYSVGTRYDCFDQIGDDEVLRVLTEVST